MNIFIITSWYPSETEPVSGIFIKEQAEALAEFFPKHNFIISNAGDFCLSIKELRKSAKTFQRYFKGIASVNKLKTNLFEFYNPALTWTNKLGGGEKNIISVHTENFLKAKNMFGKIDIMHAHVSYPAGFAAMKLKEKFNVPYVITEHMGPFPFDVYLNKGKLSYKISHPLENADRIIAVSNFLAGKLKSFGFTEPVVIPNMVNVNRFSPSREMNNNNKTKFLTVSSFIESKGIKELMDGILIAYNKSSDCEFIIAGSGYLENYIKEFIKSNSLSDRVNLKKNPARDEVVRMFKECDVFLLPSRLESFGIVYIEAMACGKPVIATDCGGPADFVNNFNGKLIPVNDSNAVAEAIDFFAKNIVDYSSKKIREFILNNFSQQFVCEKIVSVYENVEK